MGGFIGRTAKGATTTLGRGGGDFSAAIVGAALGATEIQIWTDVHGVLTADPRIVTHARTIPRLNEVTLDWTVLFVTASVAIGSGILFGLIPALASARRPVSRKMPAPP